MAQPVAGLRAAISRHMHAPLQAPRSWRFGRCRGRARAILTVLVALSGVLNILSALIERVNAIVADWPRIIPVPILHGTRTAVVVAGFGLLLLAQGLGHGSRLAWGLTVATLIGAALLHLVKGFDVPEAAIQGGVAALLVVYRDDFRARPDPPTQAGALRAAVLAVVGLPLYIALGFRVLHASFRPSPTTSAMAREALARLVLSSTGAFAPATFQARWFLDSISLIWTLALLTIGLAILRPVLHATPEQVHERDPHHDRLLGRHDRSGERLIVLGAEPPVTPALFVERVQRAGSEGEEDAEQSDQDLRHAHVGDWLQSAEAQVASHRRDQVPPVQDADTEESDVFEYMDAWMFEREVVQRRYVPHPHQQHVEADRGGG